MDTGQKNGTHMRTVRIQCGHPCLANRCMYVCNFDRGMRENGKERGGVGKEAYAWGMKSVSQ